jgi:2-phospho-L-lactate/phosphoenolpyruvate guanylyltransferase
VPAWSVVVPAKRLAVAKTRLRPLTDRAEQPAVEHEALVLALLADTVGAALACPPVAEVVVVTDEPDAADLARRLGARTLADEPDGGLNAALAHGAGAVVGDAVAALSSDLPAMLPAELAAALAAAERAPRCFVPDVHGTGTTVLTAVGTPLRPRFGTGSAQAHRDDGAVALTGDWPGLLRDVDDPDDLRAAVALGVGRHTAELLAASPTLAVHLGAAR